MSAADDDDTSALDDDWDVDHAPRTEAAETEPTARVDVPSRPPSVPADPPEPPAELFERREVSEPYVSRRPPAGRTDPVAQPPPWAQRVALAAVFLGVLGVGVSTMRLLAGRAGQEAPAAPTNATAPTVIVTAAAAAPTTSARALEAADAPATPPPAATSSSEPEPEKGSRPRTTWRFEARAARAALNALAPTLTDCRIPGGRSGKVEVVFEPDGHVSSAKPLDLYVGTFGGKCVARHLKSATVPPFAGEATAYTHVFIIPE
jgi:hypothetical protein